MVTVSSSQNLEQLRSLRPSIVIGDITERTHRGSLVWNRLPGLVYEAIDDEYDFKLFNNGNQFVLDIFKNSVLRLTLLSSVYPDVEGLYNDVGIFTRLPGENQVRKLLRAVLNNTIRVLPEFPCLGGIVIGGLSSNFIPAISKGGCVIGAFAKVSKSLPAHGGCLVGGAAILTNGLAAASTGGGVIGGTSLVQVLSSGYNNNFKQFNAVGGARARCISHHSVLDCIYVYEGTSGNLFLNVYSKSGLLKQSQPVKTTLGVSNYTPGSIVVGNSNQKLFISIGSIFGGATGDGLYYLPLGVDGLVAGNPFTEGTMNIVAGINGIVSLAVSPTKLYINTVQSNGLGATCTIQNCNFDGSGLTTLYSVIIGSTSIDGFYNNMCYRGTGVGPIWGDGQIVKPSSFLVFAPNTDLIYNNSFSSTVDVPLSTATYTKDVAASGTLTYDSINDLFYYDKTLNSFSTTRYLFSYSPTGVLETNIILMDIPSGDIVTCMDYDKTTQRLFVSSNTHLFFYQM